MAGVALAIFGSFGVEPKRLPRPRRLCWVDVKNMCAVVGRNENNDCKKHVRLYYSPK